MKKFVWYVQAQIFLFLKLIGKAQHIVYTKKLSTQPHNPLYTYITSNKNSIFLNLRPPFTSHILSCTPAPDDMMTMHLQSCAAVLFALLCLRAISINMILGVQFLQIYGNKGCSYSQLMQE